MSEMDKSAIPLAQLRRSFEIYNQTSGKSPSTYHWYSDKLSMFEAFVGVPCGELSVSINTVNGHLSNILAKVSAFSRAVAASARV